MPAPDAVNDNYTITEDQLLVVPANGLLNNDTDPDGDPLSITRINGLPVSFGTPIALASGALLTVNADGSFQYDQNGRFTQLAAGQTFNEIFTYSISDGHFGTDTASVCFTVVGVDPPPPPDLVITGLVAGLVEEEQGLPGGIEDTTDANGLDTDESGLNTVSNVVTGTFGSFLSFTGNQGPLAYSFAPVVDGTPVLKTDGSPLTDPGQPVLFALSGGVLIGYVNVGAPGYVEGADRKVFTVELDPAGQYTFTLLERLDHQPGDNVEDFIGINLNNRVLVTDTGDPRPAPDTAPIANFAINVIDDVPNAGVANPTAAPIVLDESALPPAGDGIGSATADFSANFAAAAFGADGAGNVSYALALTGAGVASGLFALDAADTSAGDGDGIGQGAQILLNQSGNTITGTAGGTDYFTIAVDPVTGVVTFTQLQNIWHDATGNPDDPETLTLVIANLLRLVQTVTDADGDTASASIALGSGVFTIQDDGPNAEVANPTAAPIVLDESALPPDGDGIGSATANFSANFAAAPFGTDGGSASYALALTGAGVASGLFALDAADTTAGDGDGIGQGAQILLNQSGNTITGTAGGTDYFTIAVDPVTGVVTFTQLQNIWHDDTGNPDNSETLTLASANLLQLVQTVTDADGDSDAAAINLGSGVFTVQDDGPNAEVANPTAAAIVLDESALPPAGDGIVSATGNFSVNFAAAAFGTDGAGSARYALALTGSNVTSGLFALDAADTSAGDGDGIGQGAQILLNQSGNTITGSVGGTNYFTIAVDPVTGVVTFTDNTANTLWHSNTGDPDDPQTLTLSDPSLLQLVQTVTDADGDGDAAAINLGSGVFTVQDDGPIAEPNIRTVPVGTLRTVDVQLIVDISGSMNDSVGPVPDFSDNRIGLARYALREFLNDNIQIQNVQFVKFSDGASHTVWMTHDDALAYLNNNNNWQAGGKTNYDAALNEAMSSFGSSSRPLGDSDGTFIYFLSDGAPNPTSAGIDNTDSGSNVSIAEWETFVTTAANDISEVFALGIGPGAQGDPLEPVSFPNTDADGNGLEDNVILLPDDDVTGLLDTLNDAIGPAFSIDGNILIDDPLGIIGADAFGADGGYIRSITVDSITYTFDGVGTITSDKPSSFINNGVSMTVQTALGGNLNFSFANTAFNAAGDWSYLTENSGLESFPYVLVDGDGDQTQSFLSLTVTDITGRGRHLTGPDSNDVLVGSPLNDVLNGGAGVDTMSGGAGNDIYFVDDTNDQVIENPGEGRDTVISTAHFRLPDNVENLALLGNADLQGYGNALNNTMFGNNGDNILDGGAGADIMLGREGNDAYFVDDSLDLVFENGEDTLSPPDASEDGLIVTPIPNAGVDTVFATIDFRLPANVEHLVLLGNADLQGYGNSRGNAIVGNAGNNLLNGDAGADAMYGGAGNDAYFVDDPGDFVLENPGEGIDTVLSSAHYRLPENVEALVLQGSADLQGYGNSTTNAIFGNSGVNLLDGGGSADVLTGGAGNDAFMFHAGEGAGDIVTDFAGNGAAAGDFLLFVGYGPGATFTNVDATHWQVNYNAGALHEVITISNGASIDPGDVLFL